MEGKLSKLKRDSLSVVSFPEKLCPSVNFPNFGRYCRLSEPIALFDKGIGSLTRPLFEPYFDGGNMLECCNVLKEKQLGIDSYIKEGNSAKDLSIQSAFNSFELGGIELENYIKTFYCRLDQSVVDDDDPVELDLRNLFDSMNVLGTQESPEVSLSKGHVNLNSHCLAPEHVVSSEVCPTREIRHGGDCEGTKQQSSMYRGTPSQSVVSVPAERLPASNGTSRDAEGESSVISVDGDPDFLVEQIYAGERQLVHSEERREQGKGDGIACEEESIDLEHVEELLTVSEEMVKTLEGDEHDEENFAEFCEELFSHSVFDLNDMICNFNEEYVCWSLMTQDPTWCNLTKESVFCMLTEKDTKYF